MKEYENIKNEIQEITINSQEKINLKEEEIYNTETGRDKNE